jgi:hypothetical protein
LMHAQNSMIAGTASTQLSPAHSPITASAASTHAFACSPPPPPPPSPPPSPPPPPPPRCAAATTHFSMRLSAVYWHVHSCAKRSPLLAPTAARPPL